MDKKVFDEINVTLHEIVKKFGVDCIYDGSGKKYVDDFAPGQTNELCRRILKISFGSKAFEKLKTNEYKESKQMLMEYSLWNEDICCMVLNAVLETVGKKKALNSSKTTNRKITKIKVYNNCTTRKNSKKKFIKNLTLMIPYIVFVAVSAFFTITHCFNLRFYDRMLNLFRGFGLYYFLLSISCVVIGWIEEKKTNFLFSHDNNPILTAFVITTSLSLICSISALLKAKNLGWFIWGLYLFNFGFLIVFLGSYRELDIIDLFDGVGGLFWLPVLIEIVATLATWIIWANVDDDEIFSFYFVWVFELGLMLVSMSIIAFVRKK